IFLANVLVSSKIDYCNSLLYYLPEFSLDRMQSVRNALARVVVPSVKRFHNISPTLKTLPWLPIRERIKFKIASLTFKTMLHKQPSYFHELLKPCQPTPRPLRSSDLHLLEVPDVFSARGRRSFLFAAPTIWNSLPISLRCSSSVASFLSGLKTHLFLFVFLHSSFSLPD